jgi:hypothetical protein
MAAQSATTHTGPATATNASFGAGLGWLSIMRLGLVQASLGSIVVLTTSVLNRVMVVELMLAAVIPGLLVGLHYGVQISRPLWGMDPTGAAGARPGLLAVFCCSRWRARRLPPPRCCLASISGWRWGWRCQFHLHRAWHRGGRNISSRAACQPDCSASKACRGDHRLDDDDRGHRDHRNHFRRLA